MNRLDFPVLKNQPDLVYLDSANTTLKPQCVVDAVRDYYQNYSANIGRATYSLSERATAAYESARKKVANFIGANSDEVIFTHSATYGVNQVAFGLQHLLGPGDVILLTEYEHNSNIIAWQQVAKKTGAKLAYLDDNPDLSRVKVFAYTLVSNVTGQVFNRDKLTSQIQKQGGFVLVDTTQAVSRLPINLATLDCDFLVFSSHKLYGPSGVGVLYACRSSQPKLKPLVYGSQTFSSISREDTRLVDAYGRFEPGTPNIEGVVGLGAAVDHLSHIGMVKIAEHDQRLAAHATSALQDAALKSYLVVDPQVGVLSFDHPTIHPHDFAMLLDEANIAVRAGKACSDILMQKLRLGRGVVRISFGIYTTTKDIDKFMNGYQKVIERLS